MSRTLTGKMKVGSTGSTHRRTRAWAAGNPERSYITASLFMQEVRSLILERGNVEIDAKID
jgi:hypothetical protein